MQQSEQLEQSEHFKQLILKAKHYNKPIKLVDRCTLKIDMESDLSFSRLIFNQHDVAVFLIDLNRMKLEKVTFTYCPVTPNKKFGEPSKCDIPKQIMLSKKKIKEELLKIPDEKLHADFAIPVLIE